MIHKGMTSKMFRRGEPFTQIRNSSKSLSKLRAQNVSFRYYPFSRSL
uniref:Uncharacterized protein n=1 Tax=Arundo donax TaxID=35708 RepID=A0A0A9GBE1_ARUDO